MIPRIILSVIVAATATDLNACAWKYALGDPVLILAPSLFGGRHGHIAGISTDPKDECPTYRVRLNARPGYFPMTVPVHEDQLRLEDNHI